MLPAVSFFIYAIYNGAGILDSGEVDNDPMRAGWILLFFSPALYLVLVMFFYIVSRILFSFEKLQFKYLELLILLISALLAFQIAHDNVQALFIVFIALSVWLSVGSVSWYYFGILSYNKQLQQTPAHTRLRS